MRRVGLVAVIPHRLDEPVGAHRAAGFEREAGHQGAQPAAADRDRPAVTLDLQRSQDADVHAPTLARGGKSAVERSPIAARCRLTAGVISRRQV
ncbi:MAG: hypothetical protein U0S48_11065 [Solirubrobacteraceae bacterium]